MKYFKKLALAVALAAAGTCSAATFDEVAGTDITISSAGEYTFTGSFFGDGDSDTWTFDLAPGYSFSLFMSTMVYAEAVYTYDVVLDGEYRGEHQMFGVDLSSGKHTLTLSMDGLPGAQKEPYNGLLAVTAVPEPETYAMFLAGLGIMGALARRRKPA